MFDPPKPVTAPIDCYCSPDTVVALQPDDECLSYLYAKEYEQTAAARIYKLKPGKEPYDADDSLPAVETAGEVAQPAALRVR